MDKRRKLKVRRFVYMVLAAAVIIMAMGPVSLAAQTKVAVMDLTVVINQSDAGKQANTELTALVARKQAEVDAMAANIESFAQQLQEQLDSLTDEEKATKQEELNQMIADYEQAVADADAAVQARAEELRNQIIAELAQVLQIIGAEEGFDVILDVSMVHYYSQVVDITYEVIRKYNALRANWIA